MRAKGPNRWGARTGGAALAALFLAALLTVLGAAPVPAQNAGSTAALSLHAEAAVRRGPTARSPVRFANATRTMPAPRQPGRLGLRFDLSVAPNNNINDAPRRAVLRLPGLAFPLRLAPESRALSGVELRAGLSGQLRLWDSAPHLAALSFAAEHRNFRLTPAARRRAPGVRGADFARSHLSIGLILGRTSLDRQGGGYLSFDLGHERFGGSALVDTLTLAGRASRRLAPGIATHIGVARLWQTGRNGRADARVWRAEGGLSVPLARGRALRLDLSGIQSRSAAPALEFRDVGFGVTANLGETLPGMRLSFGLHAARRHFGQAGPAGGKRIDRTRRIRLDATFPGFARGRFVPVATVVSERTRSTHALYERRRMRLELGVTSRF